MPTTTGKHYTVSGNDQLIAEGISALEALTPLLDASEHRSDGEALSISELEIYENTPIRAILSDDFGHHNYEWSGTGWVKQIEPFQGFERDGREGPVSI